MTYSADDLKDLLDEHGELMVVLESDREYELHKTNVEFDGEMVEAEGLRGEEYVKVQFPASAVEHWYTHYAV